MYPRSGKVFYSGRSAFSASSRLYVLGLNPGGSPIEHADEIIGRNLADWRARTAQWCEYTDESWEGAEPGTYGMAPRIQHMFDKLGVSPREVPASNVVFVRSSNEAALAADKSALLRKCWPVHEAVIDQLKISTVLCLGGTAGRWVRSLLGAKDKIGEFRERNDRRWLNDAHINSSGIAVLTVTHPGRADWRNPAADPTPLVRDMLAR